MKKSDLHAILANMHAIGSVTVDSTWASTALALGTLVNLVFFAIHLNVERHEA